MTCWQRWADPPTLSLCTGRCESCPTRRHDPRKPYRSTRSARECRWRESVAQLPSLCWSYPTDSIARTAAIVTKPVDANDPQGEDSGGKKNGDSQFASHMKAQKGSSKFAKEKTLKQQRQYLPAFASREDLLKVVRENQGKKTLLLPRLSLYALS